MSPSLKEVYDKRVPPETRDKLDDIEDMSFAKLTLKPGPVIGERPVEITNINLQKDTHQWRQLQGVRLVQTASNNDDIYVEEK